MNLLTTDELASLVDGLAGLPYGGEAQHVPAKRFLVATNSSYRALLSPVSIASLRVQGGPMDAAEVAEFRAQPWSTEAVLVRRWDDAAKDPAAPTLELPAVLAAHTRLTRA